MWENIFRVEGHIYKIGSKVWGLLILNFWLLVTSIPIVTMGTSLAASYYVMARMIKEDDYRITKNFFSSFKNHWRKSSLAWLFVGTVSLLLAADWLYFYNGGQKSLIIIVSVGVVTIFMSQLYQVLFFYLGCYETTVTDGIKNSLKIMVQQPLKSGLLLLVFVAPFGLALLSPYIFVFQLYINLFIGLSFNLFLRTYILLMMFQRYN